MTIDHLPITARQRQTPSFPPGAKRPKTANAARGDRATTRISRLFSLVLGLLLLQALAPGSANAQLTIERITWDIIGLDSNNVNTGPDRFPITARVTNTSPSTTATNVVCSFVWDQFPVPAFVNVAGVSSYSEDDIAPGETVDFRFLVVVTRDPAAYFTARQYHLEVSSNEFPTVSTVQPRQVFIEKLISQNRNQISTPNGIIGPDTILVGREYLYELNGSTATNGYEQFEAFLTYPTNIVRALTVSPTYSVNQRPVPTDRVYADSCIWIDNPNDPNYNSCTLSPSPKAGGTISTDYIFRALAPGTFTFNAVIHDFSGSSFHYNNDFGQDSITVTVIEADLGGIVWRDENLDGDYDVATESGIPNVTVTLIDANTLAIVATTTSDANGVYFFDPVLPGDYLVLVDEADPDIPSGFVLTNPPNPKAVTLNAGQSITNIDFGFGDPLLAIELDSFEASTPGYGQPVTITWETASEVNTAGFNLYRANFVREGTWEREGMVSDSLIPAQGSGGSGGSYSFVDLDPILQAGEIRAYILEEVELDGTRSSYGPAVVDIAGGSSRGVPSSVERWHLYK